MVNGIFFKAPVAACASYGMYCVPPARVSYLMHSWLGPSRNGSAPAFLCGCFVHRACLNSVRCALDTAFYCLWTAVPCTPASVVATLPKMPTSRADAASCGTLNATTHTPAPRCIHSASIRAVGTKTFCCAERSHRPSANRESRVAAVLTVNAAAPSQRHPHFHRCSHRRLWPCPAMFACVRAGSPSRMSR